MTDAFQKSAAVMELASRGYGWEDICVKLGIWRRSEEGQRVRRIVLRL